MPKSWLVRQSDEPAVLPSQRTLSSLCLLKADAAMAD